MEKYCCDHLIQLESTYSCVRQNPSSPLGRVKLHCQSASHNNVGCWGKEGGKGGGGVATSPWFFLVLVAIVMPRKSRMNPMTRSLGKLRFRRSGLAELLLAAAMATSTCIRPHASMNNLRLL